jgi:hypothetical protein
VLLYGRRRMGRVVPRCTTLNLSRAKDLVLAQALREVAYERANDPSKCPVKRGSFSGRKPANALFRLNAWGKGKAPRRQVAEPFQDGDGDGYWTVRRPAPGLSASCVRAPICLVASCSGANPAIIRLRDRLSQ